MIRTAAHKQAAPISVEQLQAELQANHREFHHLINSQADDRASRIELLQVKWQYLVNCLQVRGAAIPAFC